MMPNTKNLAEPMVRINATSGIKVSTLFQIFSLIVVGVGAFYAVTNQLNTLAVQATEGRKQITQSVQGLQDVLHTRIDALTVTVDRARTERKEEIKDLEKRMSVAEQEGARLGQQVNGVAELMKDLRDLMQTQAHKHRQSDKQAHLN